MRSLGILVLLIALVGCNGGGGSGSGSGDISIPKPKPTFEMTDHQLYLSSHECLADCFYDLECAIENCLAEIDDDLLCRGDILLLEAFGYNKNENTSEFWFAVDFENGMWDGSFGGEIDVTGKNFSTFASQAYYFVDPNTFRIEAWFVDADGNKTKPYHIDIYLEECYE